MPPPTDNSPRATIAVVKKIKGAAWLGKINLEKGKPTLWEWDGGWAQASEADFVLPCYDAELDALLIERYRVEYTGVEDDTLRVQAILERIALLDGELLHWT